ncbi:DUF2252 domain-containing protein [Saccharopolyspora flava]|uniref:Uncharacterized conserved protein, DUF2252 family n=1 Tax=Saccharopolyspora flava TaxID=95161 RepID=A0A1I6UUG9_9PSEU|nr:DUF2252 domain-containing protein [Saccharopolyspora flava]SFT05053.1 Uncharacterized conserved protein, DUF2252 family [Saccharopolyspora flava]
MSELARSLGVTDTDARRGEIADILVDAFSDLMERNPAAFRTKFRKMAADPFAFYRGSACLFYADVNRLTDPWADERTSRVWIQGDLHAQNFGTYMNASGVLVFDVNDFDEAYLGHFTWDLQRFAASLALLAWSKALPDGDIVAFVRHAATSYLDQVRTFASSDGDSEYSLRLSTTDGTIHELLQQTRLRSRTELLNRLTEAEGYDRRMRRGPNIRQLDDAERGRVEEAFGRYLESIPPENRMRDVAYTIKDIVGSSGFGIGSAGLPAYNILIEGPTEALENDIVLSMKQGNVAAPSRVVTDERIRAHFKHHGHRTALSQRALQAHADPMLGHTEMGGVGYLVDELSPYESDLEWGDLTEPSEIVPVLDYLGRAIAKIHCVSDAQSDTQLVDFQVEEAILDVVGDREKEFVDWLVEFALGYAEVVRDDHRLFVDAFRHGEIGGVAATAS